MKKVIILDDDHTYLSLLQRAIKLEKLENDVRLVNSAPEFRQFMESDFPQIGLALLDINLGDGENGFDLLAWLQQRFTAPPVPAILQSWTTEPPELERARSLGSELRPKVKTFADMRQHLRDWLNMANPGAGPRDSS